MKNLVLVLLMCTLLHATGATLRPSKESLIRQNLAINQMGLVRIKDEKELEEVVRLEKLVALPVNSAVKIAPGLPANRRYALSMTIGFLLTLSEAYRTQFGTALTVDSAVRPVNVQERLRRHNHAAAPALGETASSHESGATIDISRRMSRAQTRWLENVLSMYQAYSVVIVEEEKNCFHIQVIGEPE